MSWRAYVASRFPGYLLPASAAKSLSAEEGARFLERLTGRPHELRLVRAASTLAPRGGAFRRFIGHVADLVRLLPSRNEVEARRWQGGFHGRLDVRRTIDLWSAGARTSFVTTWRRRGFALPENILVRSIAERLLSVVKELSAAGVLSPSGWGGEYEAGRGSLEHLLRSTVLRAVPIEKVTSAHLQAARMARHACHREAARWHEALYDGLDRQDPEAVARAVAEGALEPLAEDTRFELAVVMRLIEALEGRLTSARGWEATRALVVPARREVAAFTRDDGVALRVFYNQSVLAAGIVDRGVHHYLSQSGRMRPDVTVTVEDASGLRTAVVVEVKRSADPGYLLGGYHEAVLYRTEYASSLNSWPKAILVASSTVPGSVRREDEVIAVDWERWVPEEVVDGLLLGVE